jgi:peroxiredoxin
MAAQSEPLVAGAPAPDFRLPGVDGRVWTRDGCRGANGLLVMFICNHCPYVQAVIDRIVRDARELAPLGIGAVAISANDVAAYPEDSFDHMAAMARRHGFPFPYLYDESQQVARAYGAVCTPDFFGFDAGLRLRYRGRLDASRRDPAPPGARRELFEAMKQVAATGIGPTEQLPSVGCSIKWKGAA